MENTYLPEIRKNLTSRKSEYINESLTSILNVECQNLWMVRDFGYDEHKGLRKIIETRWKNNPSIEPIIDECITYVKSNRDKLSFLDV